MTQVKKPYRLIYDGGIKYEGDDAKTLAEIKTQSEKEGLDISDQSM